VHFVIDEAVRCVHLAARMTVWTLECIFALKCCATPVVANIVMYTSWQLGRLQSRQPAKFAWVHFAAVVRRHIDGRISLLDYIVVCNWQTTGLDSDLHVSVHVLGGDRGCAETRVDAWPLLWYSTPLYLRLVRSPLDLSVLESWVCRTSGGAHVLVDIEYQSTVSVHTVTLACRRETKGCLRALAKS
jgi:hypothetical protein